MHADRKALPLVYSCSGCSSAAQMANHVALRLDRRGVAEMSCIAGVGGDVPSLVKLAHSGRAIIVIDGCQLACASKCLERHGLAPDQHLQLHDYGVKKRLHEDFDMAEAEQIATQLTNELLRQRVLANATHTTLTSDDYHSA
ncbi:putative zinc-binding protein [Herminiimonas sp.]|uniref:putative zinc-binding protein n=1 Tax=Herminiimonas sp. TaxID=1926289 RepID=UPI00271AD428|nr:putative zinc-binding protein [Herminiimonas sp.]MDO8305551.1 putative zinc-binding protein [Herminiimonas sp.]